jgi:hypothetical protein
VEAGESEGAGQRRKTLSFLYQQRKVQLAIHI